MYLETWAITYYMRMTINYIGIITLTSSWPRWRLKSPASRLFTQSFVQTQMKENIKAPRHWPFTGNSPGPMNSPHKGPVTRKMFPFDDVIMIILHMWPVEWWVVVVIPGALVLDPLEIIPWTSIIRYRGLINCTGWAPPIRILPNLFLRTRHMSGKIDNGCASPIFRLKDYMTGRSSCTHHQRICERHRLISHFGEP